MVGTALSASVFSPELNRFLNKLNSISAATKPLSHYVDINPSVDVSILDKDALVGFIPMESVSEDATGEYTSTDRPFEEVRTGYTPFADGDILWAKITPSMQNGKSCIVAGLTNGIGFGSTEFHVIRVRDANVLGEFVWEFISQDTMRQHATFAFTGTAGQQRVPGSFLEKLPFPHFSISRQRELVAVMNSARLRRKRKLREAEELLKEIDAFVLHKLGIVLPIPTLGQAFAVRTNSVQKRLDAHFHSPEFRGIDHALSSIHCERLGDFVTFSKETWHPQAHDEQTFRYITITTVKSKTGSAHWAVVPTNEAPTRARKKVSPDDIIVSLTRPHHGSIALLDSTFDGCIASTGFAVVREVEKRIHREYLWCILRSPICLRQLLQRSSGGSYPAITETELKNIMVPIPDMDTQDHIASETMSRLGEVQKLYGEAEKDWRLSKRWFEEQIYEED